MKSTELFEERGAVLLQWQINILLARSAAEAVVEVVLRCNVLMIFANGCRGQTAKPFQKTRVRCFTASKE